MFYTKKEKYAYVKGLRAGNRGKKPYRYRKKSVSRRAGKSQATASRKSPAKPIYDYSNWFDFDSKGRIKGGYTSDGFFEPD